MSGRHEHAAWRYTDGSQRNCAQCRSLASADRTKLKAKHHLQLQDYADRLPHGSASTYNNHGCRCRPCTQANTEAVARRRRR